MTNPPVPDHSVALEFAELRRSVDVEFARTDGQLALVLQRADQTDQRVTDHEARLDALEQSRWPLPSIAALVAVVALGVTAWQAATATAPSRRPCVLLL